MRNLRAAAFALAIACAPQSTPPASTVSATLAVDAVASGAAVTSVTVEAQPANVSASLAYDAATGRFEGTLTVPPGDQTVTARAYSGSTLVGTGSAAATALADQTVNVAITIPDETVPVIDVPPLIDHLWIQATGEAGQEVCSVQRDDAVAACPDALPSGSSWTVGFTYQPGTWGGAFSASLADDCGGTASPPQTTQGTSTATFQWTAPAAAGLCTLTATVTSLGGFSDAFPVDVVIAAPPPPPPPATYAISGTLAGLTGSGLVLATPGSRISR